VITAISTDSELQITWQGHGSGHGSQTSLGAQQPSASTSDDGLAVRYRLVKPSSPKYRIADTLWQRLLVKTPQEALGHPIVASQGTFIQRSHTYFEQYFSMNRSIEGMPNQCVWNAYELPQLASITQLVILLLLPTQHIDISRTRRLLQEYIVATPEHRRDVLRSHLTYSTIATMASDLNAEYRWLFYTTEHARPTAPALPEASAVKPRATTARLLSEISHVASTKSARTAVRTVFAQILALLEAGDESAVDELLAWVSPEAFPVEVSLAFLSITVTARAKLPARAGLRSRVLEQLIARRGEADAAHLLAGL
jgi:hypothetical protein